MNKKLDLTEGKPLSQIFKFSLPILLSMLLQQAYHLVDAVIVGQMLGPNFFGAVSAGNTVLNFFMSAMVGLSTGASIVVSQIFGNKRFEILKKSISTIFVSLIALTIVTSGLGYLFTRPLLNLLNVVPEYLEISASYLQVMFISFIPMMLYNIYTGILRGVGDSKSPLMFLALSTVINIVLNLLLVGPMGVYGVAIATLIANVCSVVLCFFYVKKKFPELHVGCKEICFHKPIFKKVISVGFSPAFESMFIVFSIMLIQSIVASFDAGTGQTLHLSGYGVGSRIVTLFQIPIFSVGNALSAFSAQNKGAGHNDRIKQGLLCSILLSSLMSTLIVVPALIFSDTLISMVVSLDSASSSQALVTVSKQFMFALLPFGYILIMQVHTNSALRGAGNLIVPFFSMTSAMVMRTLIAFVMFWITGDYIFAFYCFPISWVVSGACSVVSFLRGKWQTIEVFKKIKEDA